MTTYELHRPNKTRVELGDIFIPKKFDVWTDSVFVVVLSTRPGPMVVRLGGRRSGEILVLSPQQTQRSYWTRYYNRF